MHRRAGSALLVQRSPCILAFPPHLKERHLEPVGSRNVDHGVFPAATAPAVVRRAPPEFPLAESALLQSLTACRTPRTWLQQRGSSLEVRLPSSTRGCAGPPTPGLPHPAAAPPTGFLTLTTTCSLHRPPTLFHAGGAHGVQPFRASPSERSRSASRRPQPSCRQPRQLALLWPDFRAWHLVGVRHPRTRCYPYLGPLLSWV